MNCSSGGGLQHSMQRNHCYPHNSDEILKCCQVIRTIEECCKLIACLLKNVKVVAIDIQGRYIDTGGSISLLILATSDGHCFFFDLYVCPQLMHEGRIKDLLEDLNIVKVIHDSHRFTVAMQERFKVFTMNIFDTQVAFQLIQAIECQHIPQYIEEVPLSCVINKYGRNMEFTSERDIHLLVSQNPNVWESRPLNSLLGEIIARNVLCLLTEVYVNMIQCIPPDYQDSFIDAMCTLIQQKDLLPEHCLKIGELHQHPTFIQKLKTRLEEIVQQQILNCSEENFQEIYSFIPPRVLKKINREKSTCSCKMCDGILLHSKTSPFISYSCNVNKFQPSNYNEALSSDINKNVLISSKSSSNIASKSPIHPSPFIPISNPKFTFHSNSQADPSLFPPKTKRSSNWQEETYPDKLQLRPSISVNKFHPCTLVQSNTYSGRCNPFNADQIRRQNSRKCLCNHSP